MLVVAQRADDQQHKHEDGVGVTQVGGLPAGDDVEQQIQEQGANKLGSIIDQLEGYGCQNQVAAEAPQCTSLQAIRVKRCWGTICIWKAGVGLAGNTAGWGLLLNR